MRILRIRMENFGPYIDEAIDFTELNEQRLFLLEGKTGCGRVQSSKVSCSPYMVMIPKAAQKVYEETPHLLRKRDSDIGF